MTYTEQLTRDYAAIRARLYGQPPRPARVIATDPEPEPAAEPEKVSRRVRGPNRGDTRYYWTFGKPVDTGGHRWREILNEVAEKHDVCPREMLSSGKANPVAKARFECWYRIKNETRYSYPQIGRFFGKDHSTVVHGAARWVEIGARK